MSLFKGLGRWFWGWLGFISITSSIIPIYLWFRTVTVPDWIFLALIIVLLVAVVYLFAYIRRSEKAARSPAQDRKEMKPSFENMFILVAAAEKPGITLGQLEHMFNHCFKRERAGRDFNIALGVLKAYSLVRVVGIIRVEITSLGMLYLNRHSGWIKKVMKKVVATSTGNKELAITPESGE